MGFVRIWVQFKDRRIVGNMYVTDKYRSSINGRQWLLPLEIIKVNVLNPISMVNIPIISDIQAEFSDVFSSEIGEVPNYTVSYSLCKDAKPLYYKSCKVPCELLPAADHRINQLEKLGILKKINLSEWDTPVVYVEKPNHSVRLYGNYKLTLNNQLQDVYYEIPTIKDIFNKMENGTYYCKLDLYNIYI